MEKITFDMTTEHFGQSLGISESRCEELHAHFHKTADEIIHNEHNIEEVEDNGIARASFDLRDLVKGFTSICENNTELFYAMYHSGSAARQIHNQLGSKKNAIRRMLEQVLTQE